MGKKESYVKKIKFFERKHPITTAILIGFAIIMFWRGAWMLADEYLFPQTPTLSAFISIIIGLIILYFRDFDLREITE